MLQTAQPGVTLSTLVLLQLCEPFFDDNML